MKLLSSKVNTNEEINFTAFDFETATYKRMPCQLGLVVVRKGQIVEEKTVLIKPPENRYDIGCQRVHGISPIDTKSCLEFDEIWVDIKSYFENEMMVAHNIAFDCDVLNKAWEFYNLQPVRSRCFYDTMYLFDNVKGSLSDTAYALGIEMEHHHDALSDARVCAQIFIEYLKGIDTSKLSFPEKSPKIQRQKKKASYQLPDETKTLEPEELEWIVINGEVDDFFNNKRAVISGVYDKYPDRDELKLLLEAYGVKFVSAISGNTDLFIVGSLYGPKKMEAVLELNKSGHEIKILPEKQIYKLLEILEVYPLLKSLT